MTAQAATIWLALAAAVAVTACEREDIELFPSDDASANGDATPIDAGPPGPDGMDDEPIVLVADDPFGDGTAFSFVAGYAGQIYMGPAADGTGAVRFNGDGSGLELVSFSFAADTTGNATRNASAAPYPSIGRTGCTPDTAECGPDNEDGRGLFASGVVAGTEFLVVGGSRSGGDLDYVYMTSSTATTLAFRYVDLSAEQGPQTRGYSAMHVFANRLYMGFPDTGGERPYMHALINAPPDPGLDGVNNTDFVNLEADNIPGLQTPNNAIVDSFTDFGNRLYLANSGAWIRSNTDTPDEAQGTMAADWEVITPSDAAFSAKTSVSTAKIADIEPADKAVPQMAVFGGRVYAARNTTDGPQLWRCDPETTAPAGDCDAGDWSLIATNSTGDTLLSQFDDPNNAVVSMLVATNSHLYVGFDNAASGIALYRTDTDPLTSDDFSRVGSPGLLGDTSVTRIFDARAIDVSEQRLLYIVAGSGASGVKVFRIR